MKKFYSLLAAVAMVATVSAQEFTATYTFETNTTPAVVAGDGSANITASLFSAVGLTSTTTTNRFAWSNTSLGAVNTGKYFQVTISPKAAHKLSISSLKFKIQRSGTGPRDVVVRTGDFTNNLPASIDPANPELSIEPTNVIHYVNDISTAQEGALISPAIVDVTAPVVFRFYFHNAEATGGTFSVDDVVITGTSILDETLAVGDTTKAKANLVKNTIVSNELIFGAAAKVSVYNAAGQVVKTAEVTENGRLDVSALPKGNYVVTGVVNGNAVSQKIIKK